MFSLFPDKAKAEVDKDIAALTEQLQLLNNRLVEVEKFMHDERLLVDRREQVDMSTANVTFKQLPVIDAALARVMGKSRQRLPTFYRGKKAPPAVKKKPAKLRKKRRP